jgi:SAM-dependent methyltransferase
MTDDGDGAWAARQRAQAAGFDAIGGRYDEVFPHRDGQQRATGLLLERLAPGARVLDVGCGTGQPTADRLAAAGCRVTGIDISPVMLKLARRAVPGATFLERDVLDAADLGPFDAAVAFFSLLMLPRDRIVTALSTLHGLLRPGGWLALGMVEADLDDVPLPFLGAPLRLTGWPRDRLREVVTGARFRIDAEDSVGYDPAAPDAPPEVQLFLLAQR